jgi:carbon storage regulator
VLGIDGDRVKLGIEAPRTVSVLRHEVYLQVQAANAAAAATRPSIESIAAAMRSPQQAETGA